MCYSAGTCWMLNGRRLTLDQSFSPLVMAGGAARRAGTARGSAGCPGTQGSVLLLQVAACLLEPALVKPPDEPQASSAAGAGTCDSLLNSSRPAGKRTWCVHDSRHDCRIAKLHAQQAQCTNHSARPLWQGLCDVAGHLRAAKYDWALLGAQPPGQGDLGRLLPSSMLAGQVPCARRLPPCARGPQRQKALQPRAPRPPSSTRRVRQRQQLLQPRKQEQVQPVQWRSP